MLETLFLSFASLPYLHLSTFALLLYLANCYYSHGLNRYPGPFLAKFTSLWRFIDVWGRNAEVTQIEIHRKYGDVVRLAPNVLSFADPKALKAIYGLNKGFVKSDFYAVQMPVFKGQYLPSLFSTLDEGFHANLRRSVNNAFSMSAMVQYESMVDETTMLFLDQTEKIFASTGDVCDFSRWLQFYAFDVIGAITYTRRHGFLEKNEDVDGILKGLGRIFDYSAPIGQIPWLDHILWKNPLLNLLDRLGLYSNTSPVARFAKARMTERLSAGETPQSTKPNKREDLLSMFLKAQRSRPDFMTDARVLTMATSMAFAGSETTAISLSAVFYYLLKNPDYLTTLRAELDNAIKTGTIENRPSGLVSWSESQTLPYLDACIKEAFRMHPAAGLPLERIVPPAGIEICDQRIPGGTIVGCSAWVIHRNREVFGDDVDSYTPERWLLQDKDKDKDGDDYDDDVARQKLAEMNGCMFQFGMGSRTCIGKNISLMEVYKVVPAVLRRFDIQLTEPEKDWTVHNAWFVKQLDFNVNFTTRNDLGDITK